MFMEYLFGGRNSGKHSRRRSLLLRAEMPKVSVNNQHPNPLNPNKNLPEAGLQALATTSRNTEIQLQKITPIPRSHDCIPQP